MSVASWEVLAGQLEAEELMIEPGRIDRPTAVTSDDEGRTVVQLADPPVYEGIMKVRSFRPYEQARDVAGSTSTSQRYDLHIPAPERMTTLLEQGRVTTWNGPVRVGDFLTAGGRVYRIASEHDVTFQTAQRLVGILQTGGITA